VAEIQRRVTNQGGRNLASRLLHAKNDKETITAWNSDLNRILHVFNVSLVTPVWLSLTAHSQTELTMNTYVTVSDVHRGIVNTHTMVSDIHHNMFKCQEGTDDQRRLVSNVCIRFHHQMDKRPPLPRLKSGLRF